MNLSYSLTKTVVYVVFSKLEPLQCRGEMIPIYEPKNSLSPSEAARNSNTTPPLCSLLCCVVV
jgi:hypothetical protein